MRPDAHALLAPYAADALDPADARDVELHVAECRACQEDLAAMRETLAEVAQDAAEAPPDGMRAAVLAAARRTPQERPSTSPFPGPVARTAPAEAQPQPRVPSATQRPGRGRSLLALAASVALVLAVGGAVVVRGFSATPGDDVAELLAAEGTEVVRVTPEVPVDLGDVTVAGEVVAVVNTDQGRGALVARGLPPAPEGRTWQAWSLAGAQVSSAGVFEVGDDGVGLVEFDWPAGAEAVAVSLEPAGGSEQPTTDPVAVAALA